MKNKSINSTFSDLLNNNNDNQTNIHNKILNIQKIIQNTTISIQYYKMLNIFSNNDVNICINTLTELYTKSCVLIKEKDLL